MKKFDYIISDPEGIHARPAGELVKIAKKYQSDVSIEKEGKKADCKKIFGVMGLGAKKGQTVTVSVAGNDEEAACEALLNFMRQNL